MFPGVKSGVFDGLDIKKLIKDDEFLDLMNELELPTWISFVDVVKNFLGNHRAKNYKELKSLQDISANISIKAHFLLNHLDKFSENCSDMSDEQEERFHQNIKTMEEGYQGWWDKWMMSDYSSIQRDLNNIEHGRQLRKRKFLPLFLC